MQAGLVMRSIETLGSDEQKRRWLAPLASVEVIGAFAPTEPDLGSVVIVLWARGDDGEVGGYLIEKGAPGYEAPVITGKGSLRANWQADIELHAVRVPLSDLLGGNGILLSNHVIRHMADVEAIHTYEGTETIQTLLVGRDITGVGAFT